MFAYGQAYVAISRAKKWEDITIASFTFRVDKNVITEYNRLFQISSNSDIYNWSPQNN